MSDDEPPTGGSSQSQRTVEDAWKRVGVYMETVQASWDRLARRNFDFWKDVAGSLQSGSVDADTLAANAGRAMTVAQETVEDLWLTLVEPPQREVYVQVLPTAFLFFDKITDGSGPVRHTAQDPVHVPVRQQRQDLPEEALITISGNPTDPSASPADAIAALTARLRARRDGSSRSYLLETVDPAGSAPLVAGTYDGLIYLIKPTLPLANLRVVVEGPPPAVDPDT